MPWILTVSPAVARRRRDRGHEPGDRRARPRAVEEVEALIRGNAERAARRGAARALRPRSAIAIDGPACRPDQLLPADDLYARLELPADASFEAIEVAWRALLKQHHPDVVGGGADADDRAKRINVAHDWLSDPDLRARYDRERRPRRAARAPASTAHAPPAPATARGRRRRMVVAARPEPPAAAPAPARRCRGGPCPPPRPRRAADPDRDRPPRPRRDAPIAFVASIARFLPPDLLARVEAVEGRVHERLPRLGPVEPGRARLGRRLRPGDRPRGVPRRAPLGRLPRARPRAADPRLDGGGRPAALRPEQRRRRRGRSTASRGSPPEELRRIAAGRGSAPTRGGPPWPPGLRPDEDDALRVSSELARRDAVAALPTGSPGGDPAVAGPGDPRPRPAPRVRAGRSSTR